MQMEVVSLLSCQFGSVQTLSRAQLFVTPWTAVWQASLSLTISEFAQIHVIESVILSNHLIFCRPLLPSAFPNIGVFSGVSLFPSGGQSIGALALVSVFPINIQDRFPLGFTGLISLLSKGLSGVFFSTTIRKHQFFDT